MDEKKHPLIIDREQKIADIVISTAQMIQRSANDLHNLAEENKSISWWRFLKKKRLKRQIAMQTGLMATAPFMSAIQIASVMATPIPKHGSGGYIPGTIQDDGKLETYDQDA